MAYVWHHQRASLRSACIFAAFRLDVGCILWRKHMRRCWEATAPWFMSLGLDDVVCSGGINVCCLIRSAMTLDVKVICFPEVACSPSVHWRF